MRLVSLATLVAMVVAILALLARPAPVYACSCAGMTEQELLDAADVVFTATVVASHDPNSSSRLVSSADLISWIFDVDSVGKGEVGSRLEVLSPRDAASCGFEFVVGARYQVFGYVRDGAISTDLCSGTKWLGDGVTATASDTAC